MKKTVAFLLLTFMIAFLPACDENEVKQISRDGSIETIISVDHLDQKHDIIITSHKVWVKNALVKTIQYKDTIPTLGQTSQEAENSEGDTKMVSLKKDYEVYITVK